MKRKTLLYISISLILVITLILVIKFINYSKKPSQNTIDNKSNKMEDPIKKMINESYKYYLLTEGNLPTTDKTVIFVDDELYLQVTLDGLNSKNDIKLLMDDLFTPDYANGRYEEVLEKRKYVDSDNKLYVLIDKDPCDLNYSLDDKKYVINKVDDTESEIKFILDERHEYIFPIYNSGNDYKIIDSLYSCNKNIKDIDNN